MKRFKKPLATLLALLCLLTNVLIVPLAAAGSSSTSGAPQKKVVSVLYDNSTSMNMYEDEYRYQYARYAIQMLVGLLGPDDKLVINPMNDLDDYNNPISSTKHHVVVELDTDKATRTAEIERILDKKTSNTFLAKPPLGLTPPDGLQYAVKELTDAGMKKTANLEVGEVSDTQYWLIILTDGPFDDKKEGKKVIASGTYNLIQPEIDGYSSLQTVYLAFGQDKKFDSITSDLEKLAKEQPFTWYHAPTSGEFLQAMEDVANQITGRYTLPSDQYTSTGTEVTIDLNKVDYTVSNISVFGQNCDAELKSATLDGKALDITQKCVITPDQELKDNTDIKKNGFSAVVKTNGYLTKGVLKLTFTAPVNNLAVLVEPALRLEAHLEYQTGGQWTEADVATVCGQCKPNDTVRVGYRVYDRATDQEIKWDALDDQFGTPAVKITYANKAYETDKSSHDIKLQLGKGEISVQLSLMNGSYNLYDAIMCNIRNADDFYVKSDGDGAIKSDKPQGKVTFSVYDKSVGGNKSLTEAQMKDYSWTVTAYHAESEQAAKAKGKLQGDGTILVEFEPVDDLYGDYTVEIEVKDEQGVPAKGSHKIAYSPAKIDVTVVSGNNLALSQHQLKLQDDPVGNNRPDYQVRTIVFQVVSGDNKQPIALDGPLVNYKLMVGSADITQKALDAGQITIDGNRLTYTPTESNFGAAATSLGDKQITLAVTGKEFPDLKDSETAILKVCDTAYDVSLYKGGGAKVDRFRLKESNAVLQFRVTRDGDAVPEADIMAAYEAGEIKVTDKGTLSKFFWLPSGREYGPVMLDNGEWGIEVRVTRDIFRPLHTFLAMLIGDGEKQIDVTYKGSAPGTGSIVFEKSPLWSYIWRLLVIALIVYIVFFIIGFNPNLSASFPSGTFVCYSLRKDTQRRASVALLHVNRTFAEKWLWHVKRFFLIQPLWSNQRIDTKVFGLFSMTFSAARGGTPQLIPLDGGVILGMKSRKSPATAGLISALEEKSDMEIQAAKAVAEQQTVSNTVKDFTVKPKAFAPVAVGEEDNAVLQEFEGCYGQMHKKTTSLSTIIFFCKRS